MAKYLKPLRGKFTSATQQDILLRKGEMFLCLLNNDNMGQGPGAIYLGDGISAFNGYSHNGSTVANTPQPFLIHPAKYNPIFANSNPSTASWTIDAATSEINNMGNGKAGVGLPTIIGNIKGALCKHADSITKLAANDVAMQESIDQLGRTVAAQANDISVLQGRVTTLENKMNGMYPVGSIYITTNPSTDPKNLFGGTWRRLSAGYVLKTIDSGEGGSTNNAENCGTTSLNTDQLPAHSHPINSLTGSVAIGKHTHNMSSYTLTGSGTASADNSSTHSHHIDAFSVTTEDGGKQPYYGFMVEAPGAAGDQTRTGDWGNWEYEACRDSSLAKGSTGGGPHKHDVTIKAHNTTNGGKHSHPVSVSINVGQKTTIEADLGSKSVTFSNKTTDSVGKGYSHTHTTGMPKNIGVHVWRRIS